MKFIYMYIYWTYMFMMLLIVMFPKIVRKIILSCFICNEKIFKVFGSRIQKYCIFIARERCCLIILLAIPEAIVLSVNTCVIECRWNISSNVFHKMMTYIPVTKQPPVSTSDAKATTNFKLLQFTCTGPFRRSCAYFEGIIPENVYAAS